MPVGLVLSGLLLALPACAQNGPDPRVVLNQAIEDFEAGRLIESVDAFDQLVLLVPDIAPELWQRGIALYYADRFEDCRAQFESHRTVNPDDVENAAWHFMCVARLESPEEARAALLPVGPDSRRSLPEIYDMFQGQRTPDEVLESAGDDPYALFYANLYVGLYLESTGNASGATAYLERAAAIPETARFPMSTVARAHLRMNGLQPDP
jgi:lipoprotein NlpI